MLGIHTAEVLIKCPACGLENVQQKSLWKSMWKPVCDKAKLSKSGDKSRTSLEDKIRFGLLIALLFFIFLPFLPFLLFLTITVVIAIDLTRAAVAAGAFIWAIVRGRKPGSQKTERYICLTCGANFKIPLPPKKQ